MRAAIEVAARSGLRQATVLAGVPEVRRAAVAQDREAMIAALHPGLERMRAENGVKTLFVFVPPSTNFLRVQRWTYTAMTSHLFYRAWCALCRTVKREAAWRVGAPA